jgi:5-methylcytosine-specific restriction enzyme subunit McrC
MNLFEFGKYDTFKGDVQGLRTYLEQIWQCRPRFYEYNDDIPKTEEEESEEKEFRQRFLKFDGDKVGARNYVGIIQFEGQQINISPKIFKDIAADNFSHVFNHILYWLKYCRKVKFPFSQVNFEEQNIDNLLEPIIYIFAHYTEQALSEMPYHCYEEVTSETSAMRGRLAVPEYIRENLSTGRWQNLYCTYEPFCYDNLLNRIIKHTAKMLYKASKVEDNRRKLESILFILDEVEDKYCTAEDCNRVTLNRLFENLVVVLDMCRMFLSNQTVSNHDVQNQNFCFLLPMEYIFEDFVFGFIKQHFSELNAHNHRYTKLTTNKAFMMEHDIILEKLNTIVDTKYKIREQSKDPKGGIVESDMYQMVSYAIGRGCKNVKLLYPTTHDFTDNNKSEYTISSKFEEVNEQIKVSAYNLNIFDNNNISDLDDKIFNQLKSIFGHESY